MAYAPSSPVNTMYGASGVDYNAIGGGLSKLIGNYNRAYAEAKAANEQRYQQALGILNQNTGQRFADIRTSGENERSRIFQNLARSGLGSSSVGNVESMGVDRAIQSNLNRASDDLAMSKVGLIERRQDPYPDQASLASLVTGIGSAMGVKGLPRLAGALSGLKF